MKKILFFALLLGFSFTLSGCFKSPAEMVVDSIQEKASDKISEKAIEKAIEAGSGGQVDIDTEGGSMTLSNENGSTQVSTGGEINLPSGFPKELIIADDARLSVATDLGKTISVAYLTQAEQTVIVDAYRSIMPNRGWKKILETITEDLSMLSYDNDTHNVSFVISANMNSDNPEKTLVGVTLDTK